MKRILNITHNDLDGLAAGIAIKLAHKGNHVRTKPAGNGTIASILFSELTSKRHKYDRIILSDCSIKIPGDRCNRESDYVKSFLDADVTWLSEWDVVNNYLPNLIRQYVLNGGEFVVLDHHPTAIPLAEYYNDCLHQDSILEVEDENNIKRAGSELAYRYYKPVSGLEDPELEGLMVLAGDYDVWRDPMGLGGKLALAQELLDDSFTFMSELTNIYQECVDVFGNHYAEAIKHNWLINSFVEMAEKELAGSISDAKRNLVKYSDKVCSVEVDRYPSLVSHSIYTETEGIVVLTYSDNPNKISLRSHQNGGVDLGKFLKVYGGGGHALAAGLNIPVGETLESIIRELISHAG